MSEIIASGVIQADVLKKYVEIMGAFVDEAKIHFNDDGLSMRAVDPANACMYNPVELYAHGFESYETPGAVTIGISLTTFEDRLKSANSDDLVTLEVDMESRKLTVEYRGISHKVALIDADTIRQEPETSDLELPNYVEIESDRLKESAKNIDFVTDHIRFTGDADEKTFGLIGEGDTDDVDIIHWEDDEYIRRLEIHDTAKSLFSLGYFESAVKVMPKNIHVGIEFGEEFPTLWQWTAFDEAISVNMMLAPRIEG